MQRNTEVTSAASLPRMKNVSTIPDAAREPQTLHINAPGQTIHQRGREFAHECWVKRSRRGPTERGSQDMDHSKSRMRHSTNQGTVWKAHLQSERK